MNNLGLLTNPLHTFRHWKATTELHRTNNVYAVMKMLEHKSLSNTQIYIGLLPDLTDDYVCEVATTPQEIIKLLINDFEKVTEMNGQHFFRK
jgi:integrase